MLTIPHSAKQAQAVLLLSGLANVAAEHPAADPAGLKSIAYALTLQGFAVLRVDKPGCGDSEGGPAREVDFTAVVDGYVAAVNQLKQHPRIDPGQIYIVGLSLGGLQAPLVALQEPVRGIAVIGTFARSWSEYLQETTRRQLQLSGADAGQIDQHVAELKAGWQALGQEGLSPDDIMSKYPDLTNWVEQNWVDGKYFSGAGYRFFQQLCQVDVAAAWQRFDGPVLALWGSTDLVSSRADHELVAAIANGKQAGRGQFQTLEGIEHSLRAAATIEDAIRIASQPGGQPAPAVTDAVASWLKRVAE
ncbi:MAG: alpha/beta fold hydrolase [Planctomycetaceae bacterium]|nr:MAG: alpha/beta fold hydrolase [Planctomycetaceae bacterium]